MPTKKRHEQISTILPDGTFKLIDGSKYDGNSLRPDIPRPRTWPNKNPIYLRPETAHNCVMVWWGKPETDYYFEDNPMHAPHSLAGMLLPYLMSPYSAEILRDVPLVFDKDGRLTSRIIGHPKTVATNVLRTFVGPPPICGKVQRNGEVKKARADYPIYLDGDPTNNRLDNLAWGTLDEKRRAMDPRNARRTPHYELVDRRGRWPTYDLRLPLRDKDGDISRIYEVSWFGQIYSIKSLSTGGRHFYLTVPGGEFPQQRISPLAYFKVWIGNPPDRDYRLFNRAKQQWLNDYIYECARNDRGGKVCGKTFKDFSVGRSSLKEICTWCPDAFDVMNVCWAKYSSPETLHMYRRGVTGSTRNMVPIVRLTNFHDDNPIQAHELARTTPSRWVDAMDTTIPIPRHLTPARTFTRTFTRTFVPIPRPPAMAFEGSPAPGTLRYAGLLQALRLLEEQADDPSNDYTRDELMNAFFDARGQGHPKAERSPHDGRVEPEEARPVPEAARAFEPHVDRDP